MVFFESWQSLGRIALVASLAYLGLVLSLRITGKRTLSKMNAFDLIVTMALGSTLATVIVSRQTPLAEGLLALGMLVGLQYVVTFLAVRISWFRKLIKSEPTLLFFRGTFLEEQMRRERIVQDEILASVREQGVPDLADVEAVVLETDGSLNVIQKSSGNPQSSALSNVRRPTP